MCGSRFAGWRNDKCGSFPQNLMSLKPPGFIEYCAFIQNPGGSIPLFRSRPTQRPKADSAIYRDGYIWGLYKTLCEPKKENRLNHKQAGAYAVTARKDGQLCAYTFHGGPFAGLKGRFRSCYRKWRMCYSLCPGAIPGTHTRAKALEI